MYNVGNCSVLFQCPRLGAALASDHYLKKIQYFHGGKCVSNLTLGLTQ